LRTPGGAQREEANESANTRLTAKATDCQMERL
jgi:hypothetical protein